MVQKFPEDDLAKRRKAMMSSETVLDYKKKVDEARRVELARPPDVVEAERLAAMYEELKEHTKKYFDMGGRPPMMIAPGEREFMFQHFIDRRRPYSYHHDEGHCPMCEAERRVANIQKLPKTLIGVDFAKKHAAEVVSINHDQIELRIAAELLKSRDSKGKNSVYDDMLTAMIYSFEAATGKKFLDHNLEEARRREHQDFEKRLFYEIEGTPHPRDLTNTVKRLFQLGRYNDPPTFMVTTTDPNRTKADVWKHLKQFLESEIAVLPSDIKIEPVVHRPPEYGRSRAWDDFAELMNRPLPPSAFRNEVLGEPPPYTQIKGARADMVVIDEVSQMTKAPNANGDIFKPALEYFKERACAALHVPKKLVEGEVVPPDSKAFAARIHAEGRISDTTLLEQFGIRKEEKDESRGAEEVQHADGVERSQQGSGDAEDAVERAEHGEHAE